MIAVGAALAAILSEPRLQTQYPIPHRLDGRFLEAFRRIDQVEGLAGQFRAEGFHQAAVRQFLGDQGAAHQGDALAAQGGGDGVGFVGKYQTLADIQVGHPGELLPGRPAEQGAFVVGRFSGLCGF